MTHIQNDNIIILMVEKVYKFIKQYKMLDNCKNIIIGISGGADSVCLLLVLDRIIRMGRYPVRITGVHVNHGIRGDEAARDEEFARQLCDKHNIEFKAVHIDIPALASQQKLSEEEAGRIARYRIFNETAAEYGTDTTRIAVAHHMNDQAETILMNMFRGSSLAGVSGIKPIRDNIIRPLLCVDRQQIEAFLKKCNQDYITDSTNLDNEYTRNRLRNTLIPYIEANINTMAAKHICMFATDIKEADEYISAKADKMYEDCVTVTYDNNGDIISADIDISRECEPLLLRYVIRRIMGMLAGKLKDVYKTHIMAAAALCDMQTGRKVDMPYGIVAQRKYNCISFYKKSGIYNNYNAKDESDNPYHLIEKKALCDLSLGESISVDIQDKYYIPDMGMMFIEKITFERVLALEKIQNNSYTIYFDCDKLDTDLSIRNRNVNDYIKVNADGRTKKLKKELVDRKVPNEYRDKLLLLTENDEVLWICGIRRGESVKVDSGSLHIIKAAIYLREV